jgi:putative Mn2+ efflux pump MntP
MSFGSILVIAFALALDATAVAAARGLAARRVRCRHVLLVSALFGGAQAAMAMLGWLVGGRVGPLVQAWDHWIAFVLLGAIGAKMLRDALRVEKEGEPASSSVDPFGLGIMLLLAVATSIDALAVGVTLPMLGAPFLLSLSAIGITTAVLSALGLLLGRRLGPLLGRRLEVAGGLVLIGLGTKILIEHLYA